MSNMRIPDWPQFVHAKFHIIPCLLLASAKNCQRTLTTIQDEGGFTLNETWRITMLCWLVTPSSWSAWIKVRFLGPFLKKQRFWKMGNFETNENFLVKLLANLPHQVSWKMNTKWLGVEPVWYLPHPFFKNTTFSKMAPKT